MVPTFVSMVTLRLGTVALQDSRPGQAPWGPSAGRGRRASPGPCPPAAAAGVWSPLSHT